MTFPVVASIPYFYYTYIIFMIIISGYKKFRSKNQLLFLSFIPALIIYVYYKGEYSDWRFYKNYVKDCTEIGCTYFEPLYDALTFFASRTIGFYLIPLLSLILIFINFNLLKRYVKNNTEYFILILSIFLAYLPLYYGALRQSISFSFLILSFTYFIDKKYYLSLFHVLLATGFHSSTIIISLIYIIYSFLWQLSHKKIKFLFFLLLLSYLIGIILMELSFDYISILDSFNPGTQNATVDNRKIIILPVERVFMLVTSFYVLYHFKNDSFFQHYCLFSIIGALFYIIVYQYSSNTAGRIVAFYRVSDFFTIYYFTKIFLSRKKTDMETLNYIALIVADIYSLIKYYFTIVSVGFFQ